MTAMSVHPLPPPPTPSSAPPPDGAGLGARRFDSAAGVQMEYMLRDLGRMYRERNQALQEVTKAHHDALFRLALAAEYRDDDTGEHIVRMGFVAEALALATGEDANWAAMLRKAAPMHDIGKIGVPDAVLKKPGQLTDGERDVMRRHPEIGAAILGQSGIPLFRLAAEVSLTHHERWDGGGYPRGLAGTKIPLAGRIVAIVDFFDALTMDRCYRPAFEDRRALAMLAAESGHAFDPRLVAAFIVHADELIALRDRINRRGASFADLVEGPRALDRPVPPLEDPGAFA
jgi:putative two-component system response regulator